MSVQPLSWQVFGETAKPMPVIVSSNMAGGEQLELVKKAVNDALSELSDEAKTNVDVAQILSKFSGAGLLVDVNIAQANASSVSPSLTAPQLGATFSALKQMVKQQVIAQHANASERTKLEEWLKQQKLKELKEVVALRDYAFRVDVLTNIIRNEEMLVENVQIPDSSNFSANLAAADIEHLSPEELSKLPDEALLLPSGKKPEGHKLTLSAPDEVLTPAQEAQNLQDFIEHSNTHPEPVGDASPKNDNEQQLQKQKFDDENAQLEEHVAVHKQKHHANKHSAHAAHSTQDHLSLSAPDDEVPQAEKEAAAAVNGLIKQKQVDDKEKDKLFSLSFMDANAADKPAAAPAGKKIDYRLEMNEEINTSPNGSVLLKTTRYAENQPDKVVVIEESKGQYEGVKHGENNGLILQNSGESTEKASAVQGNFESHLTHLAHKQRAPFKPEVAATDLPPNERKQVEENFNNAKNMAEKEKLREAMSNTLYKEAPKLPTRLDEQLGLVSSKVKELSKPQQDAVFDILSKSASKTHPPSVLFDSNLDDTSDPEVGQK